MASTHVALITADGTSNRRIGSSLYGYCQTGASTVAKTVSLYTGNSTTTDGSWVAGDLFHGLTITVRFRYSNTATNPTLNVNSTGAKRIYKYGTTSPGTTATTSWQANSVISLTYDTLLNSSGCWVMNDHLDDTTGGGGGSVEYTLSGSGDDDEYTITATPTTGTPTSVTIPAANTTDAGVMTADDKTKLNGIASGAEVNVQADWNESNSSSDAYIQNKPAIPTVNDGTLTIQKNGTTIDSFTANQSGNTTVDITVPTATSQLTNDSGFLTSESDPVYSASPASGITSSDISTWDNTADVISCYGSLVGFSNAITLSTSETKIPLDTFTGSGCSKASNGIKVDKAGVYEISGAAYFATGFSSSDILHLRLKVNTTNVAEQVKRTYSTAPYEIMHVGSVIVSMSAGDVVYLYAFNQTAARGTVSQNTGCGIMLNRIA